MHMQIKYTGIGIGNQKEMHLKNLRIVFWEWERMKKDMTKKMNLEIEKRNQKPLYRAKE